MLLTHSEKDLDLILTIRAGVRGYVTIDGTVDDFMTAINLVASGGVVITPLIAEVMLDELPSQGEHIKDESFKYKSLLTEREREVLQLVAKGATNKDISDTLSIWSAPL
jgi:DNA-binding NarL/FixJ family response regulator